MQDATSAPRGLTFGDEVTLFAIRHLQSCISIVLRSTQMHLKDPLGSQHFSCHVLFAFRFPNTPLLSSTRLYNGNRRETSLIKDNDTSWQIGWAGLHLVVYKNQSLHVPIRKHHPTSECTSYDCAPHSPHSHPLQLLSALTRSIGHSFCPLSSISFTTLFASSLPSASSSSIHSWACLAPHPMFQVPFPDPPISSSPPSSPASTLAIMLAPSRDGIVLELHYSISTPLHTPSATAHQTHSHPCSPC